MKRKLTMQTAVDKYPPLFHVLLPPCMQNDLWVTQNTTILIEIISCYTLKVLIFLKLSVGFMIHIVTVWLYILPQIS